MEVREIVTASLSNEDVKKAIAEYASRYQAGDYVFDPETVRIVPENEALEVEVEATVRTQE